jgi:mRNA-degrading endonuclease RelE of RelBE toxin-antitoxin system
MASYRVEVTDPARREIRRLPGNVRQRVIRLLRELEREPRPHHSQALDTAKGKVILHPGAEIRRTRLASWRVVYLVEDAATLVSVLAVRERPPYQYDDL